MSIIRWSGLVGLMIAFVGAAFAESGRELSPALEQSPKGLVESLRQCTNKNQLFGFFTNKSANYVEAWFNEFEKPKYIHLVQKIRGPDGIRTSTELNDAHRLVRQVKKLADFHTEQAMISMVDATVKKYGDGPGCLDIVPRLLLRLAAQRDRAWAWAEAVDRFIKRSTERLAIEDGEERRVVESLRQVERSYDWFNAYRN